MIPSFCVVLFRLCSAMTMTNEMNTISVFFFFYAMPMVRFNLSANYVDFIFIVRYDLKVGLTKISFL